MYKLLNDDNINGSTVDWWEWCDLIPCDWRRTEMMVSWDLRFVWAGCVLDIRTEFSLDCHTIFCTYSIRIRNVLETMTQNTSSGGSSEEIQIQSNNPNIRISIDIYTGYLFKRDFGGVK